MFPSKHQADTSQMTWATVPALCLKNSCSVLMLCECRCFPLTPIVFIEGVHAWEVDGEGLKGCWQADAALWSLHVEACCRAWIGRLGQARLCILHTEYGSRRLEWLSAAPHGRSTPPWKQRVTQESWRFSRRLKSVSIISQYQAAVEVVVK